ncbi:MAG: hypothetical protein CMH55_01910 [Myxococcales bacterium]|nr:hypothetical protein [Myxococcales bacterium]
MVRTKPRGIMGAMIATSMLLACGLTESVTPDGGPPERQELTTDAAVGDPVPELRFTHKMFKSTGENMFSTLGYECFECTFEQFLAIDPPEGWSKGPTQVVLPVGELRSRPSFEGVPDAVDFVPEIPGDEYLLIVKNLDARFVETGPNGIIVEAQVMRDTVLRYAAGQRVHELTAPDGDIFTLFAYEVDPRNVNPPDFQAADALGDFTGPEGWTYSSRILEEEMALDTPETATVLAIRAETQSGWQKRE